MKRNSIATAEQTKVRVLVADDHPVVRHGIIANVKPQPDMIVVAEAGDGIEALALIKEASPDVVLLDLRMPRMDGLDVLAEMKIARLPCKVIIMTTFDSEEDVKRAMKAGARGYLLKDSTQEESKHVRASKPSPTVTARRLTPTRFTRSTVQLSCRA